MTYDDKRKNDKKYETEWSFSFEKLGDSIGKAVRSVTNNISDAAQQEVKHDTFTVPLFGTNSAQITINGSVGYTTIEDLPETSENLFEAEVAYVGDIEFTVTGDAQKVISLSNKNEKEGFFRRAIGTINNREDLYYRIRIHPSVPVALTLRGGVGANEFDLEDLQLTSLTINGGVGGTRIVLAEAVDSYDVRLEGGVGEVKLQAPQQPHVNLTIKGGVGSNVLHIPTNASLNVHIEGGVGANSVHAEAGVAVHLEGSSGLGGLDVAHHLQRVKYHEEMMNRSGVWESDGYSLATRKVDIVYRGGVGGFNLRQVTPKTV
jgi:hypothetical protein